MSDLINRITCPMGCNNSLFTETTKIVNENKTPLLLESDRNQKIIIKTYTCNCCGNTFEMKKPTSNKFLL